MTNPYRNMPYEVYLTTVHWEKTRKRKLAEVGNGCEKCNRGAPVDVHHLTYERLGEELMSDLQALCPICHCKAHGKEPTIADWNRVRFVYGWETVAIHKLDMAERATRHKTSRDVDFYSKPQVRA